MTIGIDFDGTVVTHEYPEIGKDIGAVPVLKRLVKEGNRLVLNTMRSGAYLEEAVKWFEKHGIELYGINEEPHQKEWTSSRPPQFRGSGNWPNWSTNTADRGTPKLGPKPENLRW